MAAERKVSDEELERLRHLAADGWTLGDLAAAFGVTPQHVGRLVRGDQRSEIGGTDPAPPGNVSEAIVAFLGGMNLSAGDEVLAATARALGAKLDACGASDSATAAQASPRIAAQLVGVLGELRSRIPREPDAIDLLNQRRDARRAAVAARAARPAQSNGNGGEAA